MEHRTEFLIQEKINILMAYLFEFNETITKAETRKILKRLKDCGIQALVCNEKEYRLTNSFINNACITVAKKSENHEKPNNQFNTIGIELNSPKSVQ